MYNSPIMRLILLVCLVNLLSKAKSEEGSSSLEALSSTVSIVESPTTSVTDSPSTVHIIQPITSSICNTSLITSIENENAIYKKCTCDGFHGDIDCSHLGITELPKLISFPKSIQIANFRGNKISNLNADTFYNAREVIELDLSNNRIDFISITAFVAFKKLVRLDLSHNRVWNLPRGMFQGLSGLRRLDLSYNDLINVFPGHFTELKELRELNMRNNPLQELEPKHFEHLVKLEHLDLESTLLKVIPDHVFVFTPKLKFLKLAENQLTLVPTEALHVLDHLKVLDLSGNPIDVIHEQAFHGLTGLVMLYLDRMPTLSYIENYALGDMIHLQELHCSYNFKLSDISPHALVKKSNNEKVPLAQLFLRQNDLSKIPQGLLNWNSGLELHLRDNPLYCDCHADWMINMKLKNNFQSQARCSGPAEFEGVALSDLKGQELKCGLQLSDIVLIVCGVFTGLVILALIISFVVWRRNYRGYTKPGFYSVKQHNVNDIDYTGGDDGI